MRLALLLALLLALGCAQAPAQNDQNAPQPAAPAAGPAGSDAEQQAIMDRIERAVRLPEGANPLASYERSYAWQQSEDGVRKVIGVYLGAGGESRGRRWVAQNALPMILDGGCGMITVEFDVATQRIEHVTCNGAA
ncbi:MAG TPA: hypothetical protein VGO55_07720 [Allosphingosinicella sp.]|jgi:hypothetical protein|nr:hypothetical protein [Allosphingosinicella sp.]